MKIPIIDLSKVGLLVPNDEDVNEDDYKSTGSKLYKALSEVGFAYLNNAGISDDEVAKVQDIFQKFFKLDLETKKKYYSTKDPTFGYCSIETENLQYGVKDYKEAFDVNGVFLNDPEKSPNKLVENFNETTKEFCDICKKLALRLFLTLSYGMKLKDVDFLAKRHIFMNNIGNHTVLRSTLYPPVTAEVMKTINLRLGEHSDYGSFTLLFQDDVGGLQVETEPGVFEDATPIPGTIVMNIGDTMNLWTEGRLKSTVHRVVIPTEEEKRLRMRKSLAYFLHADGEVPIETMEYLLDADQPHPEQRLFDPNSGPKTAFDWAMYKHYTAHNIKHNFVIKQ